MRSSPIASPALLSLANSILLHVPSVIYRHLRQHSQHGIIIKSSYPSSPPWNSKAHWRQAPFLYNQPLICRRCLVNVELTQTRTQLLKVTEEESWCWRLSSNSLSTSNIVLEMALWSKYLDKLVLLALLRELSPVCSLWWSERLEAKFFPYDPTTLGNSESKFKSIYLNK